MANADLSLAVIDVGGLDDPAAVADAAARLDEVNRSLAFFAVTGHGVPADLVNRMYAVTSAFFEQPEATKAEVRAERALGWRGWEPAGSSALNVSLGEDARTDDREFFTMSRPVDGDDPYFTDSVEARYFYCDTKWPAHPAEMRTVWHEYYAALETLAGRLLALMEAALGIPEGWFDPYWTRHASIMLANHYPPVEGAVPPGQLRAGAHTDYGGFTILYQDDTASCLQISDRDGGWLDVEPAPGTFIVNIGDLMARWTNDRWVSTLHRVVIPEQRPLPGRISIPFFQQPDLDATISCIPGCEGDTGPKYEPIAGARNGYDKHHSTVVEAKR